MIWGFNPGPTLFVDRPDFVWGLIASMYVANIVAVVLVLSTVPCLRGGILLRIPFSIIGPMIVVVCFVGTSTRLPAARRTSCSRCSSASPVTPFGGRRLSDCAAGARDGARRQGGGCVPPVDDHVEGIAVYLLRPNPLVSTLSALGLFLLCWPIVAGIAAARADPPAGGRARGLTKRPARGAAPRPHG